ncbi:MAG: sulfatase-like hydrolase/transferase [Bryobacteraceae bacterium]
MAAHRLARLCVAAWILFVLSSSPERRVFAAAGVRPPIILISVDTLRADHLSCYGYRRFTTSEIDRFATGGTLFAEVNAQVPLTLPSHVSMLTSTYPFANGIEDNGERLASNTVTLARVLKAQGYRTAAFVGGFVLDRRFGLDHGFDVYDAPAAKQQQGQDPGDIKRFGHEVTQAATQWLRQNAEQPFFLFVHLYDLHTPYTLPASERRRGSGYDAELGYVNDVLGKFWESLSRQGLLDRALVVFTSDHGESLREHGESTHGYFVYQSTLRVPLILHWPKQSAAFIAKAADPAGLMDIAPTVLAFAGITIPAEFQGRNLLDMIRSAPAAAKAGASEEIYSESLYAHAHFGTSPLRTLRAGPYKYIQAPRPELYDLTHDPGEKENLYETRKSLALGYRERLERLRARYGNRRAPAVQALSPESIAKLRSLGYLGGTGPSVSSSESGADPKDRIVEYEQYGRAIVLAADGQFAASNGILAQLLAKDPRLLDVRASLGLNQQRMGRHTEAAESFRAVLKQDPMNIVAHFDLAISENALHRQDEAIKELEATLALAPYYVRAEEMLAALFLEKKNFAGARSHLNHLIESDPANFTANYNLGALDCLEGKWDDGDRHLRAALRANPASVEAHNTLGSLLLRRGDLDAAREEFRQTVRLNPQFAPAHYNLGIIFRKQQNNTEAAREFQEALSADPQFRPAREALDRLNQ